MTPPLAPQIGPWRIVGRLAAPVAFLLAVAVAGYVAIAGTSARTSTSASASTSPRHHRPTVQRFSHRYPSDPVPTERQKVTGPAPTVPSRNVVRGHVFLYRFATLARGLPRAAMQRLGTHRWLLRQPVAIEGPAVLKVHHATLLIGPGAFLEVRKRGTLDLRSVHVTGVGLDRRPMTRPLPSRGFLVATEEGRLVLERDVITDLGHLGDLSYGISIRQSGRGSRITGSTIRDNYFGIYTSHGLGMRITGNRVIDSVVYGIDPQLESRDILIQRNLVRGSGLHGIILSARDREIRVMDNRVMGSRLHGIVLYRGCRHNVVRENLIRHTFDGIVLTSVSHNLVAANTIREAVRFGMRISMGASHNVLRNNEIDDALLGAYLYGGARANRLLQNRFAHDRENVRVRSDAPGNRIRPVPPRSEVAP